MTVKRFFGQTAREALRKVKAALGPEAIVISNKSVPGGVEIMAMSADSLEALQGESKPESKPSIAAAAEARAVAPGLTGVSATGAAAAWGGPAPTGVASHARHIGSMSGALPPTGAAAAWGGPAPTGLATAATATATATSSGTAAAAAAAAAAEDDYAVTLSAQARASRPSHSWQPWQPPRQDAMSAPAAEKPKLRPLPPRQPALAAVPSGEHVAATLAQASAEPAAANPSSEVQVQQLMDEMRSIKSLLERQLAGFAWGEMLRHAPVRAQLLGEMIESGFSGPLARRLVEELPVDMEAPEGRKWLAAAVNRRLRTLTAENDLVDRGGVFALVGPTGVGKTTTTAKLAARCVVRYGADKLALLTTDGYRIGAHEQLRIYGRILGVPVHVVRDGEDLRRALSELRGKHMVLIDTVGMSQRDRMVAEQAAMLMRAGDVRRLLLLNATSRGDTLDDVIRNYAGEDIAGCILSKVDETAALAPALDTVVRHGLLLAYVANGQRVPEDLHLPNRNYLLHRAFRLQPAGSVHRLRDDEVGLLMPTRQKPEQGAAFV